MTFTIPICIACEYYKEGVVCDAFPEGIPAEVYMRAHDHRLSYPGDRGITFQLKEGMTLPPGLEEVQQPTGMPYDKYGMLPDGWPAPEEGLV